MTARRRAYALLALTPLLWAGNWAWGKALVAAGADPVLISAARWLLTVPPLILLGAHRGTVRRAGDARPGRRTTAAATAVRRAAWLAAGAGLAGIAGYTTLQYVALRHTTAINGALIYSASPLFALLLAPLAGERPGWRQLAGVLAGIAGVAWVVLGGTGSHGPLRVNPGDPLMVLASALWAIYSLLVRGAGAALPPLRVLWFSTLGGLPALLAAAAWSWTGGGRLPISASLVGGLLYMVAAASLAAFTAWNEGVRVLGSSRAALFGNLLPVYTALLAVPLLGERLHWSHLAGGALVALGVAWAARPGSAPEATTPPGRAATGARPGMAGRGPGAG